MNITNKESNNTDYISVLDIVSNIDNNNDQYLYPLPKPSGIYANIKRYLPNILLNETPSNCLVKEKSNVFYSLKVSHSFSFKEEVQLDSFFQTGLSGALLIPNPKSSPSVFISHHSGTHSAIGYFKERIQRLKNELFDFQASKPDLISEGSIVYGRNLLETGELIPTLNLNLIPPSYSFEDYYNQYNLCEENDEFYNKYYILFAQAIEVCYLSYIKHFQKKLAQLLKVAYSFISRDLRICFRHIIQFLFKNMDDESDALVNNLFSAFTSKILLIKLKIHYHEQRFKKYTYQTYRSSYQV